ncbi:tRNA synthetases class I (M)-domain-containing protein [Amylocystis lapponica]|nr:tRNA synthetases class I (M)-domain-containing protein [Amylocystis lapponica]
MTEALSKYCWSSYVVKNLKKTASREYSRRYAFPAKLSRMHGTIALPLRASRLPARRVSRITVSTTAWRRISTVRHDGPKPYYVTTPIFYPNSVPHIGHLHSLVVADIIARYARLRNPDQPVLLMTGTDEHGLKIQKAAEARGMQPLAFCDELSEHFRALVRKADVNSTYFSRTTARQHHDAVQHLWRQLDGRGLIYKGRHQGWYSVSDECFYTDLQVEPVEPTPGTQGETYYISTETGSRVEWMEEENYMFRLSSFRSMLSEHYAAHENAIYPPKQRADVLATLSEPLNDLSISRPSSRLSWGIPVPDDPEHTIYVWVDALTVYLSSIGYPWANKGETAIQSGWPPDVQVIGKDIVRFHAIYLPAMLAALDLPFSRRLLAHSHWTVNRHKMSKSVGNVADPIQAIDQFGTDIVRYYLARVGGRFKDDTDWSQSQLEKHAREITSALGNLLSRIAGPKVQARVAGHARPTLDAIGADKLTSGLLESLRMLPSDVRQDMDQLQLADALERIVAALQEANMLVTRIAIWADSTPIELTLKAHTLVRECLRICGILLRPFMPSKAELLLDACGIPLEQRTLQFATVDRPDIVVGDLRRVVLFPKSTAPAVSHGGDA